MTAFWQWIGLALAAAVLCMVVRAQQPQMAGLCATAAGCILLLSALSHLDTLRQQLERLMTLGGLREDYLSVLLKVLGMSYAAELAAQTCSDLGEDGLAAKVTLLGKLSIFVLAAPMLMSLLEMILELTP
ncbi:MAG: stage III sporulation AC/AD family protein [Eubacteriales bacterium]|nr:stage III sporulation AC/AD family protein [Eubacteriales bacterium]